MSDLYLEFCKLTDARYQNIRNRHYVPNKAVHGRQLHFLVWFKGKIEGIISGSSAVYASPWRDEFFGITSENREQVLGGIVNNIVFRLDNPNHERNLGTRTLALWRRVVPYIWEDLYGTKVFGFETFILEEGIVSATKNHDGSNPQPKQKSNGSMYRADNWFFAGMSEGNTKNHDAEEGRNGGVTSAYSRAGTQPKFIYCKWNTGFSVAAESRSLPSWLASTPWNADVERRLKRIRPDITKEIWDVERPEWQARAKALTQKRNNYYGRIFDGFQPNICLRFDKESSSPST